MSYSTLHYAYLGDDTQKQTERQQSQQHVLQQAAVEKEDAVKSKGKCSAP